MECDKQHFDTLILWWVSSLTQRAQCGTDDDDDDDDNEWKLVTEVR